MFKPRAHDGQLILERRCRATGTTVQLVYSPSADEENPWETICVDHGGVCSHQSRVLATAWLSHPDEWCEVGCMPGTEVA
jgi:hypothetical protein